MGHQGWLLVIRLRGRRRVELCLRVAIVNTRPSTPRCPHLLAEWIESPPYFCAASETARDCVQAYSDTKLGSHHPHRALKYSTTSNSYKELPITSPTLAFNYLMEVFMDNFLCHRSTVVKTASWPHRKFCPVWHSRRLPTGGRRRQGPDISQKNY